MTGRIEALMPSPLPDQIAELESLVRRIVDDVAAGRDCDALIARIDAEAGSPGYTHDTFAELHGWTSPREFAELIALGRSPSVSDLTEQEIAECLRLLIGGDEAQTHFYLGVLENSFPHIPVSDMIFHPKEELPTEELAAEIFRRGRASGPTLL
ncbi:hypothetical protein ATCR1_14966 [Agrobacterium tumefaciens CCNWGS0286]|jgi:hypothetical protein|uniref:hypothetical protein n=1 Tax=Agrobacterium tumefaciens TaxID=358 RepID=UPI0002334641|nr:hypothetical protein [Agrobacterium tumefaciens]EHH05442.1 hypothetical protein ATCR1_14966 [Agrobacterium tumefaciens CCNWGS0286]UXS45901.1 hypothetical protein FY149_01145 [Agrobacterium tumefaciens]